VEELRNQTGDGSVTQKLATAGKYYHSWTGGIEENEVIQGPMAQRY
jgi:hypothetical protein